MLILLNRCPTEECKIQPVLVGKSGSTMAYICNGCNSLIVAQKDNMESYDGMAFSRIGFAAVKCEDSNE